MRMNKPNIGWEDCFVEKTFPEVVVTYDRGISKHRVQALDEPKKLLRLVVGKDGKSDFDKHTLFSESFQPRKKNETKHYTKC
jgi:hypothetical protein